MRRRTRLMCHCEEQSDVAISGRHLRLVQAIADRTHLVGGGVLDAPPRNGTIFAGNFPVIRPGTAKLHPKGTSSRFALRAPRPRWGLAMTNLLTLRNRIRVAKPTACKAVTDRLVQSHSTAGGRWCTAALPDVSLRGAKRRGNLAVHSWITGRPRRKRNCLPEIATAPLGPRNDKSGAFTIVTATGTSRSCGAGRGQPGPYNFIYPASPASPARGPDTPAWRGRPRCCGWRAAAGPPARSFALFVP